MRIKCPHRQSPARVRSDRPMSRRPDCRRYLMG